MRASFVLPSTVVLMSGQKLLLCSSVLFSTEEPKSRPDDLGVNELRINSNYASLLETVSYTVFFEAAIEFM